VPTASAAHSGRLAGQRPARPAGAREGRQCLDSVDPSSSGGGLDWGAAVARRKTVEAVLTKRQLARLDDAGSVLVVVLGSTYEITADGDNYEVRRQPA
jgi:hypothetical protein